MEIQALADEIRMNGYVILENMIPQETIARMLDRFDPCWRWLTRRQDSPWYPGMRIYRQPEPGDWGSVVRAVAEDLRRLSH